MGWGCWLKFKYKALVINKKFLGVGCLNTNLTSDMQRYIPPPLAGGGAGGQKCKDVFPHSLWTVETPLADRRGGASLGSRGSKFFNFHAVFGKNVKNNSNFGSWRPPGENPGSATELRKCCNKKYVWSSTICPPFCEDARCDQWCFPNCEIHSVVSFANYNKW